MSEFVLLFRANPAEQRERMGTPEQAQKTMAGWMEWVRALEKKGALKNPGQPLDKAGAVIKGKNKTVIDGPFAEVKDIVAGFMVIEARDLKHAQELASDCPILDGSSGSVEIRPVMQM
jgi:hypothetical protein